MDTEDLQRALLLLVMRVMSPPVKLLCHMVSSRGVKLDLFMLHWVTMYSFRIVVQGDPPNRNLYSSAPVGRNLIVQRVNFISK